MTSITSPDYPDERLVVCRNPDLAAEAATDGLYVVRTGLPEATLGDTEPCAATSP